METTDRGEQLTFDIQVPESSSAFDIESQSDHNTFSETVMVINGLNRLLVNHGSDSFYRVLDGKMELEVNGEVVRLGRKGHKFIPRGVPIREKGKETRVRIINMPPLDPTKVEYL